MTVPVPAMINEFCYPGGTVMVLETLYTIFQLQLAAMIHMVMFLVHNSASRITRSGYSLLLPGVRLHHPPNCAALYQEAPWQLAMNIGIDQDCIAHSRS